MFKFFKRQDADFLKYALLPIFLVLLSTIFFPTNHGHATKPGITPLCQAALKNFQKPALSGKIDAQISIAESCSKSDNDRSEALKWYLSAAKNGLASAQGRLCRIYQDGSEGAPRDEIKAFKWCLKAGEHGDTAAGAPFKLASWYEEGKVTKKDLVQAYFWLAMAMKGTLEPAERDILGLRLETISAAMKPKEILQGRRLFSTWHPKPSAALYEGIGALVRKAQNTIYIGAILPRYPADKAGLKPADEVDSVGNLDMKAATFKEVMKELRGTRGSAVTMTVRRKGVEGFLKLRVLRGAIYDTTYIMPYVEHQEWANMAAMYSKGWGVKKDNSEAFKWCLKAARFNNVEALRRIAEMYAAGVGTLQDWAEAYFWLSVLQKEMVDISVDSSIDTKIQEARAHLAEGEIAETDKRVREWNPDVLRDGEAISHVKPETKDQQWG